MKTNTTDCQMCGAPAWAESLCSNHYDEKHWPRPERTKRAIHDEIKRRWPELIAAAAERGAHKAAGARLPNRVRLLGESIKTNKGEKRGILTAVVYLAPARAAGSVNLCPNSTPECRAACLVHWSGKAQLSDAVNARLWKTALYLGSRPLFLELLRAELSAHEASARRKGFDAAVRLDGSSDVGLGRLLASEFPGIRFYDYTKDYKRARKALDGAYGPNYSVCFSFSGRNRFEALSILKRGGTVSVVFPTKRREALPQSWEGFPVVDGDETDARFLDPAGSVVGLRLKGAHSAQMERAGCFVAKAYQV